MNAKLPENIDISTLPDQIFKSIKRMILSGQFKSGEVISEVRIAGEFGVSRTPIREALRRLDQYGLVAIRPRQRPMVLKMTSEEVKELSLVRIALENLAISLFIERAKSEDILSLKTIADECKTLAQNGDIGGFYEKDSTFHLEIAGRTGNTFLYDQMVKMDAKVQLSRLVKPLNLADILQASREHEELLDLLSSKDTKNAELKVNQHINSNL